MKLSVIMAVRNGERYLSEAIDSVLAQSVGDYEFIIVDDASTDDTSAVLAKYGKLDRRIRVLRNDSASGPYASANRALQHATSDAIARHDADDVSPPDRFAIQLDALGRDAGVSLVTGGIASFAEGRGSAEIAHPPSWQPSLEWELLFRNAVEAGGHVMFPRIVGGLPVSFSTRRPFAEDYDLWCRLSLLGSVVCPSETIYHYRRHPMSITSRNWSEQALCVASVRQQYQSAYLRSTHSVNDATDVARFWTCDGRSPLGGRARRVNELLHDLRANFLAYVARRYGRAARETLDKDILKAWTGRLGYWLYRSMTFRDADSCRQLVPLGVHLDPLGVAGTALRHAAHALSRKVSWSLSFPS